MFAARPATAGLLASLLCAATAQAAPIAIGHDFVANRFHAMPTDELYLSVVYDGTGSARMGFETDCDGVKSWTRVAPMPGGVYRVYTFAFDLQGCTLTGRFGVSDVVRDGVVDGVAFGMIWKDAAGKTHLLKSQGGTETQGVLGMWPLGNFSKDELVDQYASDLTEGFDTMRASIVGAELLGNGVHTLPVR